MNKTESKWTACGRNGCVNGWVPVTTTQTVQRFIGKWVAEEVGGHGKFIHPETGETMKWHWPRPHDPDFELVTIETDEVTKCACHPTHWSLST